MARKNPKQEPAIIAEINEAEKRRAAAVMQNPAFANWVKSFRQKFIVNGFLIPVYTVGGRYAVSEARVAKFGDYIVPWTSQGTMFYEKPKARIRAEQLWFWEYLINGQVVTYENDECAAELPEKCKIEGRPAPIVWQEIVTLVKQLKLFGRAGGGMLMSPQDLDPKYLAQDEVKTDWVEDKGGYLELYHLPAIPGWMNRYNFYDQEQLNESLELRPPWYHLLKYTFFNAQIEKLPVCSAVLTTQLHIDTIRFLAPSLSDKTRQYLTTSLFKMPAYIKRQTEAYSVQKNRREMTWWLWNNVGHRETKQALGYDRIAALAEVPKSSVQTSISHFNARLETELNDILLGQLLRMAATLGLGTNQTYQVLAKKGLVPRRRREIDDFDELDKLIKNEANRT